MALFRLEHKKVCMRDSKIKIHEAMALVETQHIKASFDADSATVSVASPYSPSLVETLVSSGLGYFNESTSAWVFPLETMESVVQAYNEHFPQHDLPASLLKAAFDEAADGSTDTNTQVALAEIESMEGKVATLFALAQSYSEAVVRLTKTMDINTVAAAARSLAIYPIGWEEDVTKLNALLPIDHLLKKMAQEEKNKVHALQRFLGAMDDAKSYGVYSRDVLNHLVKPAGLEVSKSPRLPSL